MVSLANRCSTIVSLENDIYRYPWLQITYYTTILQGHVKYKLLFKKVVVTEWCHVGICLSNGVLLAVVHINCTLNIRYLRKAVLL